MVEVTITNQIFLDENKQTFTFLDGDIVQINSRISSTPDADPMPLSAPGDTIVFDLNGSSKIITITGSLHDSTGSNRVSGGSPTTVQTIAQQKRWLEALHTGSQTPVAFNSNYDKYTLSGDGSSEDVVNDFVDGNSAYQTYAVILETTFDELAGDPNRLPFIIRLIAGAQ